MRYDFGQVQFHHNAQYLNSAIDTLAQALVDAVAGTTTTPVAEFVANDGTEVEIASIAAVTQENYIVKEVSVSDNGTLEIPGIVLGQYQSIFVACAAQVQFSLVGFEEAVTVTAY